MHGVKPDTVLDQLLSAVNQFARGAPQADDITVLVFRYQEAVVPRSHRARQISPAATSVGATTDLEPVHFCHVDWRFATPSKLGAFAAESCLVKPFPTTASSTRSAQGAWASCIGRRRQAGAPRRAEVPAARSRARLADDRALPARGAHGLGAEPSQHLHHLRGGRARGAPVHRDGAARGAHAGEQDRRTPARDRPPAPPGRADCRRARRRARARHPAPRHQARQHLRHRARAGQDPRLRAGQDGAGRRRPHAVGDDDRNRLPDHRARRGDGHRRLHVARAGARRRARRAHRTSSRSGSCSTRWPPASRRSRAPRPRWCSTPSSTASRRRRWSSTPTSRSRSSV